jgi:hypothetical protein
VYSASLSPSGLVRLGPSKSFAAAHEHYTSTSLKRCHGLCGRSRDEGGFVRGSYTHQVHEMQMRPDEEEDQANGIGYMNECGSESEWRRGAVNGSGNWETQRASCQLLAAWRVCREGIRGVKMTTRQRLLLLTRERWLERL